MSSFFPADFAHIFYQPFSLPLPIWLFLWGGVAAVLLSFVIVSVISDGRPIAEARYPRFGLIHARQLELAAKTIGILFLLLVIATGLFGNPIAGRNFNVIFCWVAFFVGFTYLTALFGNIWKAFNPFLTIVELTEKLAKQNFTGIRTYPLRLGYYPALAVYFTVICLELIFPEIGTLPQTLSGLFICYIILTLMGCMVIGKTAWFRYADYFSVFFGLASKVSVFAYRQRKLVIRPPLLGLLEVRPQHLSLVIFICFMLSSTMYDGLTSTLQYYVLREYLPLGLPNQIYGMAVLIGTTLLLTGLFYGFAALVGGMSPSKLSTKQILYAFAPSLIPIALGYHLAHYLSYLIINIQVFAIYLSDPFSLGWNLFGTADNTVNPGLLTPTNIWYLQLTAIIAGHVAAVYVCHKMAQRIYKNWSEVIRSQLPIILLMMLLTLIALWIIAQPVYLASSR